MATRKRDVATRFRQIAVPLNKEEEIQLDDLKRRGRAIGHFVREAIVEKLARERREQLTGVPR